MKIKGVDLFCGSGGLTCGLRRAGIDMVLGVDKEDYRTTYEKNNKKSVFWKTSIEGVTGDEILKKIDLSKNDKFLLAACAPCQPFSLRNKNRNSETVDDDRKNLLCEVVRIIKEMKRKPDVIFAENVPGIQENPIFIQFQDFLFSLYYSVASRVINAADYGTPQNRRRLILIARKDGHIDFPRKTHGDGADPHLTVRDALKGLPPISAGGESEGFFNHHCRALSPLNLKRINTIPKDGGSRDSLSRSLVLECHKKENVVHKDVYGRMAWDKPAPTLTTRCVSLTNGRFGHPTQNRAISVREAARLQGFPDSYVFYGTGIDSEAKQVGNAVPVPLAEAFGRHFTSLLSNS